MIPPRPDSSRFPFVLAIVVIGIGALLRFHDLEQLGISHWDAGSYTAGPLGVGPYGRAPILPYYSPPLVPALNGVLFRLFGPSDTLAIGLAALLGTLTLIATYRLGSSLFDPRVAVLATAALASMEYHWIYSRQPLTDGPYLLFFTLSIQQLATGFRTGRRLPFLLGGAWAGAALLTKYHGFFPLVVLTGVVLAGAAGLSRSRRSVGPWKRGLKGLLLASAMLAVPMAGLLFHIHDTVGYSSFRANRQQWLPELGLYLIPQTAGYLWSCLTEWISPWTLAAGGAGVVVLTWRRREEDLWVLAWLALFILTLPLYKNYPRLPLPLTVPISLAAGVALAGAIQRGFRSHQRWSSAATAVVALGLIALTAWPARSSLEIEDRGYAKAAEVLLADPTSTGTDLLVTQHSLLFYLRDSPRRIVTYDEEGALDRMASGDFRYLVVDLRILHAGAFRDHIAEADLEEIAVVPNPLPETSLVNCAGFDALTTRDPQRRRALDTIRIYRRRSP